MVVQGFGIGKSWIDGETKRRGNMSEEDRGDAEGYEGYSWREGMWGGRNRRKKGMERQRESMNTLWT